MRMMRYTRRFLVASFCLAVTGCASGGSGGPSGGGEAAVAPGVEGNRVSIAINNDIMPGSTVTVFIVPEVGSRRRLGTLGSITRRTFTYSVTERNMDYRLVADVSGARNRESLPFTLVGVAEVQWAVSNSTARLIRR